MRMNFFRFVLLLLTGLSYACAQKSQTGKQYCSIPVGFYNVENLYDTLDDLFKNDEEFLPTGINKWTSERYLKKLDRLSEVIAQLGAEFSPVGAALVGLCEVENKQVLEDLAKTEKLKNRNYGIIHYDSPDKRGVDVALLYNPSFFTPTNSRSYTLKNPADTAFFTRDQLLVSGNMLGEQMHFIVLHWPSRRGGEKRSQPLRILAAKLCRSIVDSLLQENPQAKIIIMGDLNDDPVNESVKTHLRAKGHTDKLHTGDLYNTSYELYQKGIGTLAWRDAWNLFDQLIVSQALIEPCQGICFYGTKVFNKPFVVQQEGNFKGYPYRTYAGGSYQGGYSDHFAVYLLLTKEKNE